MFLNAATTRWCAFGIIIVQSCLIFHLQVQSLCEQTIRTQPHEPIDVVYTWVNGSDDRFLRQLHRYAKNIDFKEDVNGHRRFAENNELLYSLRSIETHMPWIRHVYIVTNGQVPSWLNLQNGHASVIPHCTIFPNRSHLPTFSSPAIEANLHRIPGISKRFLYLNDDLFIGAPVEYSTFYTPTDGQLFYWNSKVPSCSALCPWRIIANGKCDNACDVPECQMDGGDCVGNEHTNASLFEHSMHNFVNKISQDAYSLSIQTTNQLLNRAFGFRERYVMTHMPILLDVDILRDAWKDFGAELTNTSSHRFRDANDLQFQLFYAFYTREAKLMVSVNETRRKYKAMLMRTELNNDGFYLFAALRSNSEKVASMLKDILRRPRKFFCLNNDLMHDASAESMNQQVYIELARFYRSMFPRHSKYELVRGEVNPPGKYIHEINVNAAGSYQQDFEWIQYVAIVTPLGFVSWAITNVLRRRRRYQIEQQ